MSQDSDALALLLLSGALSTEDIDEEVLEIASDFDLDLEKAEEVQSIVEELGVDVDDAVTIFNES